MKYTLKGYFEPTPIFFRKVGDTLLATSQFAAGYAIVENNHTLAITFMIIGTLGKFLSNFFTEA